MKPYLITTAFIFGLLVVVHIWRMLVETGMTNPWVIATTVVAAAMCLWSLRLLTRKRDA